MADVLSFEAAQRAAASAESESLVLGACLMHPERIAELGLTVAHFTDPLRAGLWAVMADMAARGDTIDPSTVLSGYLAARGPFRSTRAEQFEYMAELTDLTFPRSSTEAHAEVMRNAHSRRVAESIGQQLADTGDVDAALARLGSLNRKGRPTVYRAVDLSDLETAELHPVEHVMESYLPRREVTLLGGHGGAGKSQLALTWVAHIACGQPWAGVPVAQGRCLVMSLEDGPEVVRYRLKRICRAYGLPIDHVIANVRVHCSSSDNPLAVEHTAAGVRSLVFTRAFDEVRELSAGMDCICIDNASDAYAGDEIIRRQVRAFVSGLGRLAAERNAAVLLLVHIDKAAARNGADPESYSGSTAWHNSARSRIAIAHKRDEGTIVLQHAKANHAQRRPDVVLEFQSGVIVPVERSQVVESLERNNDDDQLVAALRAARHYGITIPAAEAGPRTWFHVLDDLQEFAPFQRNNGRKRARQAMARLKRAGTVAVTTRQTAQRKQVEVLELAHELAQNPESCASSEG